MPIFTGNEDGRPVSLSGQETIYNRNIMYDKLVSIEATSLTPAIRKENRDEFLREMIPFHSFSSRPSMPPIARTTSPQGDQLAGGSIQGSVLLPDGRVFIISRGGNYSLVYNPIKDTWKQIPHDTSTSGNLIFIGGIPLPDGRVFMTPLGSASGRRPSFFDYRTDTITAGSPGLDVWRTGSIHYGACLAPDGRVVSVGAPVGSNFFGVWNLKNDTYTEYYAPEGMEFGNSLGIGLASDGTIWGNGRSGNVYPIFDWKNNTADGMFTDRPSGGYTNPANMLDGNLICPSFYDKAMITVINPIDRIIVKEVPAPIAVEHPRTLPDGRVIFSARGGYYAAIYDPTDDSLTYLSGENVPNFVSVAFRGCTLLPNGEVFLASTTQAAHMRSVILDFQGLEIGRGYLTHPRNNNS